MMKVKQYIPTWLEMPEPGEVRELVNREGDLKLGVVYGILPKERCVLIRELTLTEQGEVTRGKIAVA